MHAIALLLRLAAFPTSAEAARTLDLGMGTARNVEQVLSAIINYMAGALIYVLSAMVIVGAFFIVISRGESEMVSKGKNLIIGSVIGAAVVLGAYSILRTVFYFIYA